MLLVSATNCKSQLEHTVQTIKSYFMYFIDVPEWLVGGVTANCSDVVTGCVVVIAYNTYTSYCVQYSCTLLQHTHVQTVWCCLAGLWSRCCLPSDPCLTFTFTEDIWEPSALRLLKFVIQLHFVIIFLPANINSQFVAIRKQALWKKTLSW